MICPKCQGKGFIEEEHGLVMIQCDCDKGHVPEPTEAGTPYRGFTTIEQFPPGEGYIVPDKPKKVKRGTKRTR